MTTLTATPRLAIAKALIPSHLGWLSTMTLFAHTVVAWLILTVTAGTWMFYNRITNPPALFTKGRLPQEPTGIAPEAYLIFYWVLALLACSFLIFPVLGLGASSARIGTKSRSKQLATMRLIGMSRTQTSKLALVNNLALTLIGFGLGAIAYLGSLPVWARVAFQGQQLTVNEMLLPWHFWLLAVGTSLLLSAATTITGLRQLHVSPLGVIRRQVTPELGGWRIGAFLMMITFAAAMAINQTTSFRMGFLGDLGFLPIILMLFGLLPVFVTLLGLNLISPYLLQTLSRLGLLTDNPARLIAARRVVHNPKETWRGVSSLTYLSFLTCLTLLSSPVVQSLLDRDTTTIEWVFARDVPKGALITLTIAAIATTVQTALAQADQVLDRAGQMQRLGRMGINPNVIHRARVWSTTMPMMIAVTVAISLALGLVWVLDKTVITGAPPTTWLIILDLWLIAIAFSALAAVSNTPLENHLLQTVSRSE